MNDKLLKTLRKVNAYVFQLIIIFQKIPDIFSDVKKMKTAFKFNICFIYIPLKNYSTFGKNDFVAL